MDCNQSSPIISFQLKVVCIILTIWINRVHCIIKLIQVEIIKSIVDLLMYTHIMVIVCARTGSNSNNHNIRLDALHLNGIYIDALYRPSTWELFSKMGRCKSNKMASLVYYLWLLDNKMRMLLFFQTCPY